jgi:OFA family oxalate/formate antiporter-like MFS transporter
MFIGFFLAASLKTLTGLYTGYGIMCGWAVGIGYNAVLRCFGELYPGKLGVYNGYLLMMFGFSSFVMGILCNKIIVIFDVHATFLILGFLYAVILFICSIGLRTVPDNRKKPLNTEQYNISIFKQFSFYIIYSYLGISASVGLAVVSIAVPLSLSAGIPQNVSALTPGLISICNGFGRLFWGLLFDKKGRICAMLALTSGFILASVIFVTALTVDAPLMLFPGFILFGLSFGGIPLLSTTISAQLYGRQHYGRNLAIMGTHGIFGSLSGPLLAGFLYDYTHNYQGFSLFSLAISIVPLALIAVSARIKTASA